MKMPLILSCLVLSFFTASSQNGKILSNSPFAVNDSIKDRSAFEKVQFYHLEYLSDGLKIKAFLAVPKARGKHPCVIVNRGGNKAFGTISDESFIANNHALCAKGYVIIASQYREAGGSEGKDEFGGKDVNDVLNLLPVLNNIPGADTSRIGMFGWSRGGMMTYIALTKTNRIKTAVVGSGLADLFELIKSRPVFDSMYQGYIPGYLQHKQQSLESRSAVYFADRICKTTPLLILHGSADWRVPAGQVFALAEKLYEAKQPFRFHFYEGGQHSLSEFSDKWYPEIVSWFDDYLRDGKNWPSLEVHGE
jgi:dipeptidyl aminopeptidase/acylaminoacyl peptidase